MMKSFFALASLALLSISVSASPVPYGSTNVTLSARANPEYPVNCASYPEVCNNFCYWKNCKHGSMTVTVDRKANLRPQSGCGGKVNRCSSTSDGSGGVNTGWKKNPVKGLSCDEQPKNTNKEGGAPAATRCVPAGQNSGEGSSWAAFINGKNGGKVVPDGGKVDVSLGKYSCAAVKCVAANPKNSATDSVRQL